MKPANILLDAQGEPHVTDFGLAKRFGEGEGQNESARGQPTPTGLAVGTPSCMAPEQVLSPRDVTTAADVFSLGCIFYELLTGRAPFRAETPFATLLNVVEKNPQRPRAIWPTLDRDLEVVCLQCLEKEPVKRYASAAALADDLRRFAAGEPIQARPVRLVQRFRRWCRRQPLLAGLAGVLIALTITAFALITWQWQRAEHNFAIGQQHLAEEQRQKKLADERLQQIQAEQAEAQRQKKLADERLEITHEKMDEFCLRLSEERLRFVPGTHAVRKYVLQSSVEYFKRVVEESPDDPKLRLKLARAHHAYGEVLGLVDSKEDALREYRSSLLHYEELLLAHRTILCCSEARGTC